MCGAEFLETSERHTSWTFSATPGGRHKCLRDNQTETKLLPLRWKGSGVATLSRRGPLDLRLRQRVGRWNLRAQLGRRRVSEAAIPELRIDRFRELSKATAGSLRSASLAAVSFSTHSLRRDLGFSHVQRTFDAGRVVSN